MNFNSIKPLKNIQMKLLQLDVQIRSKKETKNKRLHSPLTPSPLSHKSHGSRLSPKRFSFMALSRHFLPTNWNFTRVDGTGESLAWLGFMDEKNKLSQSKVSRVQFLFSCRSMKLKGIWIPASNLSFSFHLFSYSTNSEKISVLWFQKNIL